VGCLTWFTGSFLLVGLLLSGCSTSGPQPAPSFPTTDPVFRQPSEDESTTQSLTPEAGSVIVNAPRPLVPHQSLPAPRTGSSDVSPWMVPNFDPDSLTFGWVTIPQWPARAAVIGRFWSLEKKNWQLVLGSSLLTAQKIFPLQVLYSQTLDSTEKFWSAFLLERFYLDAGLPAQARQWRSRALLLRSCDFLLLDELWYLAMIQRDQKAAAILWRRNSSLQLSDARDRSRLALLRQTLFLSKIDLPSQGLDSYVSTLSLDLDDLWIGTWNGGLARLSLVSGEWLVLERPKTQVSPLRLIKVTRWFVYAFKEKGFSRYSKVTRGWKDFTYPPNWSGLRIQSVSVQDEEKLWVAHLGQGLWCWDSGQWSPANEAGVSLFVNSVVLDARGRQLVGTQDNGFWIRDSGEWTEVKNGPTNISAITPSPSGDTWAIGTWGEGLWLMRNQTWQRLTTNDFVTGIDWNGENPWWGSVDQGLLHGSQHLSSLGVRDGLQDAGVTALVTRAGRLYWGTMGQSIGVWSEDDDPLVYR